VDVLSATALDTLVSHVFAKFEPDAGDARVQFDGAVGSSESQQPYDERVTRLQRGDVRAFTEIVQTHYNALVRFAASILLTPHDAEDIVQDVLVRVWDGRERLDPRGALHTYLFTAVRNRALNRRRETHTYEQRIAASTGADAGGQFPPTPAEELERHAADVDDAARLLALSEAIRGLRERNRTALILRFERGLTHAEIGEVLGISDKAAQQVVLRTIAELRGLLRPGAQ
jgi:RNA polymerase sigma-70 factor (ECF subfamily)